MGVVSCMPEARITLRCCPKSVSSCAHAATANAQTPRGAESCLACCPPSLVTAKCRYLETGESKAGLSPVCGWCEGV